MDDLRPIVVLREPSVHRTSSSQAKRRSKEFTFGFKFGNLFKKSKITIYHTRPTARRPPIIVQRGTSPPEHMAAPNIGGHFGHPRPLPPDFVPLPRRIQSPIPPRAPSPLYRNAYLDSHPATDIDVIGPRGQGSGTHHGFVVPWREHRRANEELLGREEDRRRRANQAARNERERRRGAEQATEQERRARERERTRRHEMENLTEQMENVAINERRARVNAEEEARRLRGAREEAEEQTRRLRRANERAEERARHAEREARVAERERAVLERERQHKLENRRATGRQALLRLPRPLDILYDPPVPDRDRGADIIRKAQDDALLRRERRSDDELFYGHVRDRHRDRHERRGSRHIFDDDFHRDGHRHH